MNTPKNPKYSCDCCNFNTANKKDYTRHTLSAKHLSRTDLNVLEQKTPNFTPKNKCEICNKSYISRSGLWNHKKKCSQPPLENTLIPTDLMNPELIISLIKDNQEFKSLLMESQKENKELINKVIELSSEPKTVTNCNNTTNNNQHFNLHFFLNETCKDAINMAEFLKSIEFQMKDLEETARLGYVEGVSRIFIRALKDVEETKRPIHCTDIKRETVYVKNNDNWEKDNPEKKTLKKAVDYIANKNMNQINDWKEQNPSWTDHESEEGRVLNQLYMTTIGGGSEEEDTKYVNKIIKNVLREVVVDR